MSVFSFCLDSRRVLLPENIFGLSSSQPGNSVRDELCRQAEEKGRLGDDERMGVGRLQRSPPIWRWSGWHGNHWDGLTCSTHAHTNTLAYPPHIMWRLKWVIRSVSYVHVNASACPHYAVQDYATSQVTLCITAKTRTRAQMCCKSVAANVFAKTGQAQGEQRGEDK